MIWSAETGEVCVPGRGARRIASATRSSTPGLYHPLGGSGKQAGGTVYRIRARGPHVEPMTTSSVWFVTGASKGLGLALVRRLLERGYRVAATSRSLAALTRELGDVSDRFLPLEVDLSDARSLARAVDSVISKFGALDVVVNNAGYGQFGTVEEVSDAEARRNFDVNVFGLLNVLRATLPQLRAQRSGHMFNISSIGGFSGEFSGWGIYCATKFAVAGLTEALRAGLAALGGRGTAVDPGVVRAEVLSPGLRVGPATPHADF